MFIYKKENIADARFTLIHLHSFTGLTRASHVYWLITIINFQHPLASQRMPTRGPLSLSPNEKASNGICIPIVNNFSNEQEKCSVLIEFLRIFNPSLWIITATRVPDYLIGAFISRVFPNGTQTDSIYAACELISAKHNCEQITKEALAIMLALKNSHKISCCHSFIFFANRKPLFTVIQSEERIMLPHSV